MSAQRPPHIAPAEYLRMETSAPFKSEYYRGELFPMDMAGATRRHNRLTANLLVHLRGTLAGRDCDVFTSDMRVHVAANTYYTYPDVLVVCGEQCYLNENETTLLNPVVVIEVLSPSTEHYDRGAKFGLYRDLESLQEYMLVAQDERRVEVFTRSGEGSWETGTVREGSCPFASLNVIIGLDSLYEGTGL
ncbi:MAG: Uma2 family endonuclease [Rhodothermales bacterium]